MSAGSASGAAKDGEDGVRAECDGKRRHSEETQPKRHRRFLVEGSREGEVENDEICDEKADTGVSPQPNRLHTRRLSRFSLLIWTNFSGRAVRVMRTDRDCSLASLPSGDGTVPKAERLRVPRPGRVPHAVTGVLVGFAAGLLVLAAYFAQASWGAGGLFWDVFLIPAWATLPAGALVAAAASSPWRKWWIGVAGGVALMVPLFVELFVVAYVAIGFE